MQGQQFFTQQIPAQANGQWPQTASVEQQPQGLFLMTPGAQSQGYLPPNQQPAPLFAHQGIVAPNGATPSYAGPQGVCQAQPQQLSFIPNSVQNPLQNHVQNPAHNLLHNPNPLHNFVQNPVPNPLQSHMQNAVQNPLQNHMQNPVQNPLQNPLDGAVGAGTAGYNVIAYVVAGQSHNPLPNPVQNPLHSFVQNPLQNPVQNPLQNPVQNPLQNPAQNPIHNPLQNSVQNPLQNPVHNSLPNAGHTSYLNQQQYSAFVLPGDQVSGHNRPALNQQLAPSRGLVSDPPLQTRGFGLAPGVGRQPVTQDHCAPPVPAMGPFHTGSQWRQNGPPGMQPAPTALGQPQRDTGRAQSGNQGPPSSVQNRYPTLQHSQHPSRGDIHAQPIQTHPHQVPTPQPSGTHSTVPSRGPSQSHSRTYPSSPQQLESGVKTGQPEGGFVAPSRGPLQPDSRTLQFNGQQLESGNDTRKLERGFAAASRGPSQSHSRTDPSNGQQLERGDNTGMIERGLKRPAVSQGRDWKRPGESQGGDWKRPAESQGGDWKRQRNEGVRVPGWKAKETEAVDVSDQFALEDVNKDVFKKEVEKETDAHRLKQRQKQIDFGKNTLGYERYLEQVPRFRRQKGDPQTPKTSQVCSKRSWDGQIKKWRRLLHKYDPPVDAEAELAEEEYLPGYRGNTTGQNDEDAAAEPQSAEEEETVTVEASVFEVDEDEFVGL